MWQGLGWHNYWRNKLTLPHNLWHFVFHTTRPTADSSSFLFLPLTTWFHAPFPWYTSFNALTLKVTAKLKETYLYAEVWFCRVIVSTRSYSFTRCIEWYLQKRGCRENLARSRYLRSVVAAGCWSLVFGRFLHLGVSNNFLRPVSESQLCHFTALLTCVV